MSDKKFFVETNVGGYAETYTYEDAWVLACEDSIERSCVMMVRHETEYVPRVIFHSGNAYILQEREDVWTGQLTDC
jgi:hypothetical protein